MYLVAAGTTILYSAKLVEASVTSVPRAMNEAMLASVVEVITRKLSSPLIDDLA